MKFVILLLHDVAMAANLRSRIGDFWRSWRQSKKLILFIVLVGLFLDNILVTIVVPIVPSFLYKLHHPHDFRNISLDVNSSDHATELLNITADEARHRNILDENVAVCLLFASKAIAQLIVNPFIGPLTNRIGYSVPMFTGYVIMFISTLMYAFGENYALLFAARALQGIGSSCSTVSGLGMLADTYTDDGERGNAMGIALGGIALGILVGPPIGGVMYEYLGKEAPFLLLAALILLGGLLMLSVIRLEVQPETLQGSSLLELLKDPYILLTAGSIAITNVSIGMVEPTIPLWMIDTMRATEWQQGIVFVPACLAYIICTSTFGLVALKIGRWLSAIIGMVAMSAALFLIPFCTAFYHLLGPVVGWGVGIGVVDAVMFPMMGYLVDLRHVPVYGTVYAIADFAICLGLASAALSGLIVHAVGFRWMAWIMAIVTIVYVPPLILLRNPPSKAETQNLIEKTKNVKEPVQLSDLNSNGYQRFSENSDDDGNADDVKGFVQTDSSSTPPK